eukprot:3339096-Prymnesium_polylepis.1
MRARSSHGGMMRACAGTAFGSGRDDGARESRALGPVYKHPGHTLPLSVCQGRSDRELASRGGESRCA